MTKEKKVKMKIGDFEICHFCNLKVVPLDFSYEWNLETIREMQDLLGTVPEKQAGKIGNKIICNACVRDLEGLLNFEYRQD